MLPAEQLNLKKENQIESVFKYSNKLYRAKAKQ